MKTILINTLFLILGAVLTFGAFKWGILSVEPSVNDGAVYGIYEEKQIKKVLLMSRTPQGICIYMNMDEATEFISKPCSSVGQPLPFDSKEEFIEVINSDINSINKINTQGFQKGANELVDLTSWLKLHYLPAANKKSIRSAVDSLLTYYKGSTEFKICAASHIKQKGRQTACKNILDVIYSDLVNIADPKNLENEVAYYTLNARKFQDFIFASQEVPAQIQVSYISKMDKSIRENVKMALAGHLNQQLSSSKDASEAYLKIAKQFPSTVTLVGEDEMLELVVSQYQLLPRESDKRDQLSTVENSNEISDDQVALLSIIEMLKDNSISITDKRLAVDAYANSSTDKVSINKLNDMMFKLEEVFRSATDKDESENVQLDRKLAPTKSIVDLKVGSYKISIHGDLVNIDATLRVISNDDGKVSASFLMTSPEEMSSLLKGTVKTDALELSPVAKTRTKSDIQLNSVELIYNVNNELRAIVDLNSARSEGSVVLIK